MVLGRLFVAPEFLRQGTALQDIRTPTRIVIGIFAEQADPEALALVTDALAHEGTPLQVMRAEEASLVKNASNVFLALRLTFVNDVAGMAEDLGVDVGPVLEGIGHDPRIDHAYMRPSFGFGGSCLPKEVRTLSTAGLDRGPTRTMSGRLPPSSWRRGCCRRERICGPMIPPRGATPNLCSRTSSSSPARRRRFATPTRR